MSGICTDDLPVIVARLKEDDDHHAHRMIAIALDLLPEWQRPYAAPVLWNLYASAHCQGYNARVLQAMRESR